MSRSMPSTATTSVRTAWPARPARRARRAVRPRRFVRSRRLVGSHPSRRHPGPSPPAGRYSLTDSSVSKRDAPARPPRRPARTGAHPARRAGTPTRPTTPRRSTRSSAGSGSAPAAPTTSPRRARTWRRPSPASRSWSSRDDDGVLRAFLNVCRHRGSPLADRAAAGREPCPARTTAGSTASTARWPGPAASARRTGSTRTDSRCGRSQVTTFARSVLVNVDPAAAPFDPGPLAAGLDPYRARRPRARRAHAVRAAFNWKVLLENYCENYHTPFIHSQLPTAGYEYPIECAGPAVIAWDRPLAPQDPSEQALHDHRPGEPGLGRRGRRRRPTPRSTTAPTSRVPQHRDLVLRRLRGHVPPRPDRAARPRSSSASTTGTRRSRPERRAADLAATREVVEQDLRMCELLQGTYDAGLSADGVLSTEHERRRRPRPPAGARRPRRRRRGPSLACAGGVHADPHPHRRRICVVARSSRPRTRVTLAKGSARAARRRTSPTSSTSAAA